MAARAAIRILLVEDEELLREFAAESLQEEGFEVHAVGDAEAGLETLKSEAPFDLLLSDIRLPGMSGCDLATAGKALRPDLKIILMTGYAPQLTPDVEQIAYRVLQKPFRIDSLAGLVHEAMAGA